MPDYLIYHDCLLQDIQCSEREVCKWAESGIVCDACSPWVSPEECNCPPGALPMCVPERPRGNMFFIIFPYFCKWHHLPFTPKCEIEFWKL